MEKFRTDILCSRCGSSDFGLAENETMIGTYCKNCHKPIMIYDKRTAKCTLYSMEKVEAMFGMTTT